MMQPEQRKERSRTQGSLKLAELPAFCFPLSASFFLLPGSCFQLSTSCFLILASYSQLPASSFQFPASCFLLSTSCFQFPASFFQLPHIVQLLPLTNRAAVRYRQPPKQGSYSQSSAGVCVWWWGLQLRGYLSVCLGAICPVWPRVCVDPASLAAGVKWNLT